MPYALSDLVHGRRPGWRGVSGAGDVSAGEAYYEGDPPKGWVWDSGTLTLRAPTAAEDLENNRLQSLAERDLLADLVADLDDEADGMRRTIDELQSRYIAALEALLDVHGIRRG